ncbi:lysophospholipid acyltransferase family protein [Nakamurella endophytica]|uniref:Glycerol acyltransferase n=1 Tax=Nakamurella endophytica TaxID=1748367 RepID=A0A917SYR1_9ACTN|nr:lysophospholipid acyltransferase family protein [Nakamurella endophytica]GGM04082.1 glycerol acyltransferase [Nakamurella endophytica]
MSGDGDGPDRHEDTAARRSGSAAARLAAAVAGHPSAAPPEPADPSGPVPGAADDGAAGPGRPDGSEAAGAAWQERLAGTLAFLRRRLTGEYEIDEFGFDQDWTEHVWLPPLRLLFEKWFRVEVLGVENLPDDGGVLLVANHSGTVAVDALMLSVAVHDHHPRHRPVRMLGADLVFDTPVVGPVARKAGNTLACNEDAERLLRGGECVSVFPEGFKGVGKPFSQRYKLQRFGRGGFVSAAIRSGVPIVPCSIVGAEEIYPLLGSIKPLARALGLPYFPVTPTFPWLGPLGAVPLPSKWIIEFGEPVSTDDLPDGAAEDPMVVFNMADSVRETIQQSLYRLLLRRGHPFLR